MPGELLHDGGVGAHRHGATAGALVGGGGDANDLGLDVHGEPLLGCGWVRQTTRVERTSPPGRAGYDYWMTVESEVVLMVMVPPQEHLSEEAATRTIWAWTYMVDLWGWGYRPRVRQHVSRHRLRVVSGQ